MTLDQKLSGEKKKKTFFKEPCLKCDYLYFVYVSVYFSPYSCLLMSGFASSLLNRLHDIVSGSTSVIHSSINRGDGVVPGPSGVMQATVSLRFITFFFLRND